VSTNRRPTARPGRSGRSAGRSAGRPSGTRRTAASASHPARSGNPAVRAAATAAARTPARRELERASRPALTRLAKLPRWLLLLVTLAVVAAGVLLPSGWGAAALVLLAVFLGWLLALSWPVLGRAQRALRLVTVWLVLGAAAWKAFGT